LRGYVNKRKEIQQNIVPVLTEDDEYYEDNQPYNGKSSYWSEYEDVFSMSTKQVNDAFIDALAKRLVRWSQHARSISIVQFLAKEGIPQSTYHHWQKRNKNLKMANEHAKNAIASRLSEGAIFADSGMREHAAAFMLPHYDKDYRQQVEWRAKIREANSGEASDFVIQVGVTPSSDMVPHKKVKSIDVDNEEEVDGKKESKNDTTNQQPT
jgi:hypothetical protein